MSDLVARLREACSREGKLSGRHMIDGQRMIAKHFRRSNEDDCHDLADVAETMAACIENEARLFDLLAEVATEAADLIESLSAEVAAIRVERDALEDHLEDALSPEVTDVEIEDALTSEGVYVWGPDGERFERMFAIVMKSRTKEIDSVRVLAGEGVE